MNEKNKVAIITGASKGIGKAIAIGLSKMAYQTVLIGRNKIDLDKVVKVISKKSEQKTDIIQLDITKSESVKITILEILHD